MLVHEVIKVLLRVLSSSVLVQQVIQIVEHLVDALTIVVGGVLQRLLHPGEPLIEHLAAEQILDLLVLFARLLTAPVIVGQLLHGLGRRRGQRLDPHLLEPGVVVKSARQLLALGQHRLVEQLLDLLQRAVEVVALQQFPAAAVRLGGQLVGAAHILSAAPKQLRQRSARRRSLHHVLPDLLERLAQIDRRRQRVRATGVAGVSGRAPVASRAHGRTLPLRFAWEIPPQRSSSLAA